MTSQVLFFNVFPEKDPHLNVVELCFQYTVSLGAVQREIKKFLDSKRDMKT